MSERCTNFSSDLSTLDLLRLSTLYHELISDLSDLFDVSLTSAQRAQAFEIVCQFAEAIEKYGVRE